MLSKHYEGGSTHCQAIGKNKDRQAVSECHQEASIWRNGVLRPWKILGGNHCLYEGRGLSTILGFLAVLVAVILSPFKGLSSLFEILSFFSINLISLAS